MLFSVFCQFPFGHVIVCLLSASLCPWYCLSFEADKRQTITWPKGNWQKTDNNMTKGKLTKDRQYQGKRETDQFPFCPDIVYLLSVSLWPCYCLSFVSFPLAMLLQYHGQMETDKRQTISWPKGNWQKRDNNMAKGKLTKDRPLWPCYCLSFVSFPFALISSVFCQFPFGHDIVCLLSVSLWPISWPKGNWQKTDNNMAKGKLTKDRQ
jgi:hypothetical protein